MVLAHFGRHFRVTIVDFLSDSVLVSSLEVALGRVLQRISREPARECGTSALWQSTAAQIESFSKIESDRPVFSDLLRLRMAAVEEQCCAPGLRGRSGNTSQQQGTTSDRFSPYHWLSQSNKQRPPVIHECRHSGGDLRALEILGCEPAPTQLVLQFVECVLCIAPIPIELGKCEVLPLPRAID